MDGTTDINARFRILLAQLNPVMGDLSGNSAKALAAWKEGRERGVDLVALPEMFLTGYQTQDLIRKPAFVLDAAQHLDRLMSDCVAGPAIAIGGPFLDGTRLHNAYHVFHDGRIVSRAFKHFLPNFNVFDEVRVFNRGQVQGPWSLDNHGPRIGNPICEDAWYPDVTETMAECGAEILVIPNGSPYFRDKMEVRLNHMVSRVVETGLPLVYLNLVGGQDDQMFDGGSFVLDRHGALVMQMPLFEEGYGEIAFMREEGGWSPEPGMLSDIPCSFEQDYRVMVEALRDYMSKTGFSKTLLGLSGGIDSALVAAIAVDALGADQVRCVMLPSRYTSESSLQDAADAAGLLRCQLDEVSIAGSQEAVHDALAPLFEGQAEDVTEENIQSRLRGLLLMAQSNKFGEMLLTTGNKSEVAVGYATIYGDMSGGYNPIKDLYKTRVFDICRWRNRTWRTWMKGPEGEVVPVSIIEKPPSAELRPDQKDEDSLPPYEVLDGILKMLVDDEKSVADCVEAGYEREIVKKIEHLIYISEYKRFQSAPGARLSPRAFWLDRRYPIVNRWRDPSG
ncbi:NAD+ synthase [Aestuariibius insulae]|uniref:NAD+ synthase n=1 Tax=Aestuariibius insulae TaxID=2058287 RepID=UPI00345E5E34